VNGPVAIKVPTPFAVGDVNCYLLPGTPPALVDVGPATDEAWEALTAGLKAHGCAPRDIGTLCITHAHVDHHGQAWRLAEINPGLRILAHPRRAAALSGEEGERRADFLRAVMSQSGVPAELMADHLHWRQGARGYALPVRLTEEVDAGRVIDLGDCSWHVLHTPGHTSDSVCLAEGEGRWMLSGDTVLESVTSHAGLEPDPASVAAAGKEGYVKCLPLLGMYADSLTRLLRQEHRFVLPGHGGRIDNWHQVVRRRLRGLKRRRDRVAGLLVGRSLTLWELCDRLFPSAAHDVLLTALTRTIGLADWVVAEGEASVAFADGLLYYSSPADGRVGAAPATAPGRGGTEVDCH